MTASKVFILDYQEKDGHSRLFAGWCMLAACFTACKEL